MSLHTSAFSSVSTPMRHRIMSSSVPTKKLRRRLRMLRSPGSGASSSTISKPFVPSMQGGAGGSPRAALGCLPVTQPLRPSRRRRPPSTPPAATPPGRTPPALVRAGPRPPPGRPASRSALPRSRKSRHRGRRNHSAYRPPPARAVPTPVRPSVRPLRGGTMSDPAGLNGVAPSAAVDPSLPV